MLRSAWAWLSWAVVRLGYVIRPYDDIRDARRWRWQPRAACAYRRGVGVPHMQRAERMVAGLIRRLPPPPDPVGGQIGGLGPTAEELARAIVELLALDGWRRVYVPVSSEEGTPDAS